MDLVYFYKTSDGVKRQGEITAQGVEDAYAALRQQGIRAIKVVPKGLTLEGAKDIKRHWIIGTSLGAVVVALLVGTAFWMLGRWSVGQSPYLLSNGEVKRAANESSNVVQPTTRHQIAGDPEKAEKVLREGAEFLFRHPSERYLAAYAIPGRAPTTVPLLDNALKADFMPAIKDALYTFPGEMQECVELKRIVAGMKEELKMFLTSGGTVDEYVHRIQARQAMEIDYRVKAEKDLAAALVGKKPSEAYAVWHDLNAWLNAMGILRLPLPQQLSGFDERQDQEKAVNITTAQVVLP